MWVGGLLFGVLNVFMFAFEKAWSVADGVRNWGNWFFNSVEVTEITIINPHLYSTSILNFGVFLLSLFFYVVTVTYNMFYFLHISNLKINITCCARIFL
jgi:hypothetical protein